MNSEPLLKDLRVFCLVARKSGFAAAADALGASPAYVSKRIQLLEGSLGVKLLHRSTRRVAVTEAGERVYRWAQSILDDVDHMVEDVSATRLDPRGLIRISSSFGFGRVHVAPAIAALAERYPELEVRFDVSDRLVDLAGEGIDLDIRVGNGIAPQLMAKRLAGNRRILCASPLYLERRGVPRHLDELAGHDCLVIKERDHPFGVWRLTGPDGEVPVRVTGPLASNHGEIVHQWAMAGRGIMLRSLWDVRAALAAGTLVHLLQDHGQPADVWAVYPSRLSSSAKLRVCVEFLERHFREVGLGSAV
ncbi:LysR substrate-binding domain-containing protein [Azospirillum picis]|uniref:LysR family transcriptional activator of dmlA n=1 Tax=Azospirillum picis TaxID=488438 RepID=A0ABU0MT66_9PROT|nr:LysR substrate-binding domain-containing protein [Azospirillum picis]MBP2302879.1 LysR family transcriptional activator of dmlA [Azospirillum picis]MDQ0536616.1 LysR family transcriptional activator of dmlA [Azospirillum picis]